jgi:hypothetical protein
VLTACEESVNPILESNRQLTLWGTLDMNADVQFLRVVPIREVLDVRLADPLELHMESLDLTNGERVAWKDSLISFPGDRPAILFYANLRVAPTHTYRIMVSSPALEYVTTAETTIPEIPEAEILDEDVQRYVSPSGFTVSALQDMTWHNLHQAPYRLEQWYRFLEFGNLGFTDYLLPFVPPDFSYSAAQNDLDLTLNLVRHRDSVQKYINLGQVRLVGLGQTITVLDDAFVPPGGEFSPELLAQPGTMSNVEYGFGFVGSVGRFSVEWILADSSAALLEYTPLSGFSLDKQGPDSYRPTVRLKDHPWEEAPAVRIPDPEESGVQW